MEYITLRGSLTRHGELRGSAAGDVTLVAAPSMERLQERFGAALKASPMLAELAALAQALDHVQGPEVTVYGSRGLVALMTQGNKKATLRRPADYVLRKADVEDINLYFEEV